MVMRARVLGFSCGLGLIVSAYTAGVLATEVPSSLTLTEHDLLIFVVGPGAVLLFSVMGWFARGAYNNVDTRLKHVEAAIGQIPERFVSKDDWRHSIDTLSLQLQREMDFLRERLNNGAGSGHNFQ